MDRAEFDRLAAEARDKAQEKIDRAKAEFGLGAYARYDVDLPTARIVFRDATGAERIRANIQLAGSWAPEAESWLWGWENESVPEAASGRLAKVREFGEANGIEELRSGFEPCDEAEAWTMAAVASHLLDAECVYRVTRPTNTVFLLLFELQKVV